MDFAEILGIGVDSMDHRRSVLSVGSDLEYILGVGSLLYMLIVQWLIDLKM